MKLTNQINPENIIYLNPAHNYSEEIINYTISRRQANNIKSKIEKSDRNYGITEYRKLWDERIYKDENGSFVLVKPRFLRKSRVTIKGTRTSVMETKKKLEEIASTENNSMLSMIKQKLQMK